MKRLLAVLAFLLLPISAMAACQPSQATVGMIGCQPVASSVLGTDYVPMWLPGPFPNSAQIITVNNLFTGRTITSPIFPALTLNALVLGGGAGTTPTPVGSLGTTTTVLHGNATGAPTFGAVNLGTDVTSTLPVANGGTNLTAGTSGGILGYTATGTLASSALLAGNGLVIGGGAGATPTAIAACTNGQVPVGVTSAAPACQTLSGDVSAVTSGGAVTVSKIGGAAITLAAAGTFYPGHSLIGIQTFCNAASGCTTNSCGSGCTYTADAGTNQVIIRDVAAGGGSGGCGVTDAAHGCASGSGASGSYAEVLFTSGFSGITMTVGAPGTAGAATPGVGGTGGTVSAGSLVSCPGGTGGMTGAQNTSTSFVLLLVGVVGPSACTTTGGTVVASVAGQASGPTFFGNITIGNQFPGQGGNTPLGFGPPALGIVVAGTSHGLAGTGYGWGAGGAFQDASQASGTTGLAGGPGQIVVFEFN